MNTDKLLGMLLEAIDYSFLQMDGSYDKTLTYPVIDKIQYIKEQVKNMEVKEVDLDVMQRMEECPYRQVGCTMYEGKILECTGACSWVVDYPKLKELKAQKGEEVC